MFLISITSCSQICLLPVKAQLLCIQPQETILLVLLPPHPSSPSPSFLPHCWWFCNLLYQESKTHQLLIYSCAHPESASPNPHLRRPYLLQPSLLWRCSHTSDVSPCHHLFPWPDSLLPSPKHLTRHLAIPHHPDQLLPHLRPYSSYFQDSYS